ncbi:sugar ABC transporter substrate-binding protein [Vibrio zhanjiangensis]|uniref:Autoinducer 2-binding periplasmic protein LuxP n=1 Tax=Vibrio zhanjiangensis TaxID=1046128 RepID=A0ABQ6EU73_9VIBR|nr:ABC transporter substrate-binding protein [Vibrio zhanjiangensis]GLT16539.1 sugar ABC transporter substrate-binding protein [Vibrio zhanjiangensis]
MKIWPLIVFIGLIYSPLSIADNRISVVFINPGQSDSNHATGGFWSSVTRFMKAASDDLNIDLEVLYAERNHFRLSKLVREIGERETKPDYIILVNEKGQGGIQLEEAISSNIKTMFILNTLSSKHDIERYGKPRATEPNWIGSLIPDNYLAGYMGALSMLNAASKSETPSNEKIQAIGIAGDHITPAAVLRNDGFKKAISEKSTAVTLRQVVVGDWSEEIAMEKTMGLLSRYPKISAVWSANDPMALGAISAAKSMGRKPGQDIFFSGLNWGPKALKAIQNGELVSSIGGHFMTGGWALVLLYDYHNGIDFGDKDASVTMQIFDKIDICNVDTYLSAFGAQNWDKIDFTRFSKSLNPELKEYPFSLQGIFDYGLRTATKP